MGGGCKNVDDGDREPLGGLRQMVDINGSASEDLDESEEHSGESLHFLKGCSKRHKLTVGRNVGFEGIVSKGSEEMRKCIIGN